MRNIRNLIMFTLVYLTDVSIVNKRYTLCMCSANGPEPSITPFSDIFIFSITKMKPFSSEFYQCWKEFFKVFGKRLQIEGFLRGRFDRMNSHHQLLVVKNIFLPFRIEPHHSIIQSENL